MVVEWNKVPSICFCNAHDDVLTRSSTDISMIKSPLRGFGMRRVGLGGW